MCVVFESANFVCVSEIKAGVCGKKVKDNCKMRHKIWLFLDYGKMVYPLKLVFTQNNQL